MSMVITNTYNRYSGGTSYGTSSTRNTPSSNTASKGVGAMAADIYIKGVNRQIEKLKEQDGETIGMKPHDGINRIVMDDVSGKGNKGDSKTDASEDAAPVDEDEGEEGSVSIFADDGDRVGGKVTFNYAKRLRQLEAAKTTDQARILVQILVEDVRECQDGYSKGWCDKNEVAKAEAMHQKALQRMSQLSAEAAAHRGEDDEHEVEDLSFYLNMLM